MTKQKYLIFVGRTHYSLGSLLGFAAPLGFRAVICETFANLRDILSEATPSIIVFDCDSESRADLPVTPFLRHQVVLLTYGSIEGALPRCPSWGHTLLQTQANFLEGNNFRFAMTAILTPQPSATDMLGWGHVERVWTLTTGSTLIGAITDFSTYLRLPASDSQPLISLCKNSSQAGANPTQVRLVGDGVNTGMILALTEGKGSPSLASWVTLIGQSGLAMGSLIYRPDQTLEMACFRQKNSQGNLDILIFGLDHCKKR